MTYDHEEDERLIAERVEEEMQAIVRALAAPAGYVDAAQACLFRSCQAKSPRERYILARVLERVAHAMGTYAQVDYVKERMGVE